MSDQDEPFDEEYPEEYQEYLEIERELRDE